MLLSKSTEQVRKFINSNEIKRRDMIKKTVHAKN